MRILAISSQVAYGPVGLTASVPALQAKGHEVLAVPTIMLSYEPSHGKPAGYRTSAGDLAAILNSLESLGALQSCAAVMTGYFAAADQVHETAGLLVRMKASNQSLFVLVDPVIGDGEALYVPQAVADAIRDQLLPLATCTTPNRFELAWLTQMPVTSIGEAVTAARRLGVREVLATSIPAGQANLATLAVTADTCAEFISAHIKGVPHGTGDFLAGLYLAERLTGEMAGSLDAALIVLQRAIARSVGLPVLDALP